MPEAALGLLLAQAASTAGEAGWLHVARSATAAGRIAAAARALVPDTMTLVLPGWDCLPFDRVGPSRAVMGRRMTTLAALARRTDRPCLLIATVRAAVQRLPPPPSLGQRLCPGDAIDAEGLRTWLLAAGYRLDDRVDEPGEAAIRGAVADLYPAADAGPVRLDIEEERIARIRRYDPLTQRGGETLPDVYLGPASELPVDADSLARCAGALSAETDDPRLADLAAGRRPVGIEHRLPLFVSDMRCVFDLLPDAPLSLDAGAEDRAAALFEQIADAHATRRLTRTTELQAWPTGEPDALYLAEAEWRRRLARRRPLRFEAGGDDLGVEALPLVPWRELSRTDIAGTLLAVPPPLLERARRRLERRAEIVVSPGGWAEAESLRADAAALVPLQVSEGFACGGRRLVGLPAEESAPTRGDSSRLLMPDLAPGDPVVHEEHGIGFLRGIETVTPDDVPHDCLVLDYAGGNRLLVPVEELDRLWRYGGDGSGVKPDRLTGDSWTERRAEVEAAVAQVADRLIALARARAAEQATPLQAPAQPLARFAARFGFPETPDQAAAIAAVIGDLARTRPMRRLVCGDVGYGKTEVALRAAAVAAFAGRQVALLAPTTVLARQHLETFRRRFAGFDVAVAGLSRLGTAADTRETLRGLRDGSVRVVVGTHALLSSRVRFHDLGLVIVDEEQRFGTDHKAALGRFGQGVHRLTLTATPIPRTLQGALVGIEELSVIATPPRRRRPIRTVAMPFDPVVLREALLHEHNRGGQSFVVCPRIADLPALSKQLDELVPELERTTVHGRMKPDEVDAALVGFAGGEKDLLLATNIIESGLDIPNANTMIVWRPDRFGLAQLHQLRGRVGRSATRAFVYLMTDPAHPLAEPAVRRLQTLETLEALGSGFAISLGDLDQRGAGDLLGDDQSGHLTMVGTELYQELLAQAVRRARGEAEPAAGSPVISLGLPLSIPDDHVPEETVRIALYRRLATLENADAVDDFAAELADRFGPSPVPVQNLLALARLRLAARAAGIAKIDAGDQAVAITLPPDDRRLQEPPPAGLEPVRQRLILDRPTAADAARIEAAETAIGLVARALHREPGDDPGRR